MTEQIITLPKFDKVSITYTLYTANRRLCDIANICSVTDKFFCDALVSLKRIEEDNYLFIPEIKYIFGSIDKDNPRVEVLITPIENNINESDTHN